MVSPLGNAKWFHAFLVVRKNAVLYENNSFASHVQTNRTAREVAMLHRAEQVAEEAGVVVNKPHVGEARVFIATSTEVEVLHSTVAHLQGHGAAFHWRRQ